MGCPYENPPDPELRAGRPVQVDAHFDPEHGYPADLAERLSGSDMALLSGGDKVHKVIRAPPCILS